MKLGVSLLITTLFATGISLILYTFHYIEVIAAVGLILSLDGMVTILYSIFSKYAYPRLYIFSWGAIVTAVGLFLTSTHYVSFSQSLPLFIGIILIILGVVVIVNEVAKIR